MLSTKISTEHTSIPKSRVYLDTNGGCNLACTGCFEKMDKQTGRPKDIGLNLDQMKEIVDFTTKSQMKAAITYTGKGEPLLDKNFWSIYDYVKQQCLENLTFTNGVLITDVKNAKKLLSGGSVIVKKNSMNPEIQNTLVGNNNGAKLMQIGLDNLLIARKQLIQDGVLCGSLAIDSYIGKDTVDELPDLLRYCRRNQIIPYFESFIEIGQDDEIVQRMTLSKKKLIALFQKLKKIDKEEFDIDTPIYSNMRTYGRWTCKNAAKLSIRTNGDVFPCISRIEDPLGTIYDKKTITDSLKEILAKDVVPCCICSKTTGDYENL